MSAKNKRWSGDPLAPGWRSWIGYASLVIFAHIGALIVAAPMRGVSPDADGAPVAFIELAPVAVAPATTPQARLAVGFLQLRNDAADSEAQVAQPEERAAHPIVRPAESSPPPLDKSAAEVAADYPSKPTQTLPTIENRDRAARETKTMERPAAQASPASLASIPAAPPPAVRRDVERAAGPVGEGGAHLNAKQIARWTLALAGRIERSKRYPPSALHAAGVSRVAFIIDRAGRLLAARIVSSSGSFILDEEALATIHRAAPFAPPPPGVSLKQLSFVAPIRFLR